MYEANPIAFLAEQAGGVATDGGRRILDIQPTGLHQRTPLLVGERGGDGVVDEDVGSRVAGRVRSSSDVP